MPHVSFLGGNNVVMRGTEAEEKQFVFCPDENVPFVLDIAGITPPDPKYFISRECCDHYILFYVAEGSGHLDYNGTPYELKPGDTVLLTPKSRHRYYPSPEDPFKIVWINFFCDWLPGLLKGLGLETPVISGVSCGDKLIGILRLAQSTPNNSLICFPVMRSVNEILVSLSERAYLTDRDKAPPLALKIKDLLDEAIYGRADINEIAAKLYISKSSVYREFEKYYGGTPYNYVLGRKIDRAKSLLYRTDYTIADIAEKLSFSDEFYFSNLFKRKTGLSPSAYRKQFLSPDRDTVYPPPEI